MYAEGHRSRLLQYAEAHPLLSAVPYLIPRAQKKSKKGVKKYGGWAFVYLDLLI